MRPTRIPSLPARHAISLGATLGACALIAVAGYGLGREYDATIETAAQRTRNLSRVLEEHARQSLRRIEICLARAAEQIDGTGELDASNLGALRERLRLQLPHDSLIRAAVIDRDGTILLATNLGDLDKVSTAADRDYFIVQRKLSAPGVAIGAATTGRVKGTWMLPVSVRLTARVGFRGVLLAVVEPAYFQGFYDSIDVGPNGFVTSFAVAEMLLPLTRPHVALVDLGALNGSPTEAVRRMRAARPALRIACMAGEDAPYREAAAQAGADFFIVMDRLHDELHPVLERVALELDGGDEPWTAARET